MSQEEVDILKRALAREKAARKAAEKILEDKSEELYESSKKIKELLEEKSSQLQGIFENIVDAYVVMDINGKVIKFNDAASDLFGYDINKEELNVTSLIFKEDYEYAIQSFQALISKGYFKDYEARVNTKHKGIRWVHINASLVKDKNDKPIAAQGIVRDITSQKDFAEQLIKSENRLSSLIANLDSAVLLEDEERKIILTNQKFCDLFRIPVGPELMKGQDCSNAAEQSKVLFQNEEEFVNRIDDILRNKELVLGDEVIMKNGTILERDFVPILQSDQYRGHLWTYKDVTLRRSYRKSLEAQRHKYRSIITNMNLGLVEVDNNDGILMINKSMEEMSGFSETEVLGKKAVEIFQADKNILNFENEKRLKGHTSSYEIQVKHKSGEDRYWLVSGGPNYNLKGEVIGTIGIHLDITDLKALERERERLLSKLEKSNDELQEYAHIVSHDLKSPLRSIDALVSWLEEDNKEKLDVQSLQNINLIKSTLENMEDLISDILEYSSLTGNEKDIKPVDIQKITDELLETLLIPDHISLKIHKPMPTIRGDEVKLKQLFQNLISNAVKYNDKEKGLIEIEATDEGTFYEFSISDNGIGIDPKDQDKVFKIFHAVNKSKDSTGIGLSIVKKIINLHGGDIWLDSELGKGTTFYFTLKK